MTKAERRGPAHVTIAHALGIAIVTGTHPCGATLPGEVELAQQFAVSRSVIRESLRMLSAKGLVESRPRAGTRVRDRAHWNLLDPEMLAWMFEGAPSLGFVRSLFQLRMIVEPAAAELAAIQRSAAQLSRMGHALEIMAAHGLRTQEGQSADQRFHATILEATGNELLASLSSSIAAAVRWTTFFKYRTPTHYQDPIPLHRELFEAIANGDGAAARVVTERLIAQAQRDTEAALAA
ncbi:MAG: GntR family transcriptional regulator [Sphingomonas taxi]|uniref:GntR family transcriptional regulator n=1 Tax=Sphingomonas taxi TaxID=1549858 RepID=A0A2W5P2Q6_9SPHN|nr:MAG: GntR family transcriptional regulator [Sphingomonas taxi]